MLGRTKVRVDKHRNGYDSLTVRADVAPHLQAVVAEAHAAGAIITSAGGIRSLAASVGPNRSKTSLHYTGRAIDLALYSGMVDPATDPYVCTLEGDGFRVWARCDPAHGHELELDAVVYTGGTVRASGHFLDLTELFARHGWQPIPPRPAFWKRSRTNRQDGAAEWWHFQWQPDLIINKSTFGAELAKLWPMAQLEKAPPWRFKGALWRGRGFA